ncbi:DUF5408 family protein [Helicobacter sp. MIT 14-3879]|uniref:DUF5408 family protein n=1 Tax=Helicobacter sp. MIT 14-3879 TaxID=2040649 RepID=UPI000E1F8039|nr:DUF5408 family protein [Helicobacter sp. MIT 14-3879]RDU64203.1 hypothetical protein CQA44_04590 [Helicobacter sp. MIT 14-3879]
MSDDINKIYKKAILAIKISLVSVFISLFIGLLSLWVLLNQVTVSVGIDKKLKIIETHIGIDSSKTKNLESKIP